MKEVYNIFKRFVKKHKLLVASSISCSVASAGLDAIVVPRILANLFQNVDNSEILKKNIIKLVATWAISQGTYTLVNILNDKVSPELASHITEEIVRAVFTKYELDFRNFNCNVSILLEKINLIKKNIQDVIHMCFSIFIPRVIVLFISVVNFFKIHRKLGICVVICVAIQLGFVTKGLEECVNNTLEEIENKDIMYSYMEDVFFNIDSILASQEGFDVELKRLGNIIEKMKQSELNASHSVNKKQGYGFIGNLLIFGGVMAYIFHLYKSGELPRDKITITLLTLKGLFENIYEMTYFIPEFTRKIGLLKSNEAFLRDIYTTENKAIVHRNIQFAKDMIRFKNVTFRYENGHRDILTNFTFDLPEKKIIALHGQSGGGKSTFVGLLYGILAPTKGKVLIGGVDIHKINIKQLREHVSYLGQNTTKLFSTTLYKNAVYGVKVKPNMKNEVKTFILRFGLYKTFTGDKTDYKDADIDDVRLDWDFLDKGVGKQGKMLSGGQKQIVHLIRIALNEKTKIVILDEPTSALDCHTRDNVFELIRYLNQKGKTILIIAHDKDVLKFADDNIYFDGENNPLRIQL
jgi:ABC-type multidrug transport system fused ATPase/permease subunit